MKKLLVLVLALSMTLSMLVGCGSGSTEEETVAGNPDPFVIGYLSMPIQNPAIESVSINLKAIVEAAGGTVISEVFDFTPEGSLNGVEKLIANGADGIVITPMADSTLPKISQMCEDAGVYWAISMRTISDPEVKELVESSTYFVGYCNEAEEDIGYDLTKGLIEQGVEQIAFISTAKGDSTGDAREIGMNKAADEAGVDVVAEVRAISQATDATKAVQSFIAAYPDLDGVVILTTGAPGAGTAVAKAIEDSGKDIKFATCNTEEGIDAYFDKGIATNINSYSVGFDVGMATVLLVNSVIGTPLVEDGKPSLHTTIFNFASSQDLTNYTKFIEGGVAIYTPTEAKDLLKFYNPDVTIESLQEMLDNFSLDDLATRHADLVQ